jgi:hypothetical protein
VLRKGDVLMEFDGIPIANDGTVPFRARERIFFTAFTTLKPTGSTARVKVRCSVAGAGVKAVAVLQCERTQAVSQCETQQWSICTSP